ncbi:MAG: hypothetical protein D3907_12460, partial [Candidatus Electrothrix sp. AUS3]|nr:hypothetical protein [Candidatus Electrothrix gigas]
MLVDGFISSLMLYPLLSLMHITLDIGQSKFHLWHVTLDMGQSKLHPRRVMFDMRQSKLHLWHITLDMEYVTLSPEKRSPHSPILAHQPSLENGQAEDNDEKDHGHGRTTGNLLAFKSSTHSLEDHGGGGIERAAFGHDLDLIKEPEREDGGHRDHEQGGVAQA